MEGFSREKILSPESESEIPFDAIHLVVYGTRGEGKLRRPDTTGLMEINSVCDLVCDDHPAARNVLISGVTGRKSGEPRVSELYAELLRRRIAEKLAKRSTLLKKKVMEKLGIDEETFKKGMRDEATNDIQRAILEEANIRVIAEAEMLGAKHANEGARDTGGEVSFVLNESERNKWRNILTVGYKDHLERIRKLYASRGAEVDLGDIDIAQGKIGVKTVSTHELYHPRLPSQAGKPGFDEKLERSPFYQKQLKRFKEAERLKILFMDLFDPTGKLMSKLARLTPEAVKNLFHS